MLTPMPHQVAATKICMSQRATLVAFEPGVGKSQVAISCLNPTKKNIIVCPASLVANWKKELELWNCKLSNVEIKSYNSINWLDECDTLILDEAHLVKNPQANRTINVSYVAKQAKRIIALTATPILNRYQELIDIMNLMDISKQISSNIDNLTKANLLLRVKLQDVIELPEPKFQESQIELSDTQEIIDIQEEINSLYEECDNDFDKMWDNYSMILVGQLSKIRRHVGISKIGEAIKQVNEQLQEEPDEPIIIFGHHKLVLEALAETFNAPLLYGGTSLKKRNEYVEEFQAGKHKVIVCSIQAAGVGLTLTKARKVFFVEMPWTNAEYEQAYGRSYRKGQARQVIVTNLISSHQIDQRHLEILATKKKLCSALDDKRENNSVKKTLVKALLSPQTENDATA